MLFLLYIMLQNQQYLHSALLSANETSAHDTSLLSAVTNPYAYFDRMGIDLQDFTLRYLRQPRKNGVSVTGTFNISGIYYTAGAADVPQLLADVLERYHAKQAYHHRCQDRKQERNLQTFNISGIYYTAGAADVPQLLADVLERYHAKQAYHHRCQDRKQERNLQTYINRYPDAMVLPAYFS